MRRSAAAARTAAASVEDRQVDSVRPRDVCELFLSAIDRPLCAQVPGVLAGVGVADHHLGRTGRIAEHLVDDSRRSCEVVERLEERHDAQVGLFARTPDVADRRCPGDDQCVERLRPVLVLRRRGGGERGFGALRSEIVRVEPYVELREVEPEDLDHPLEPRDTSLRNPAAPVRGEAASNHGEIGE